MPIQHLEALINEQAKQIARQMSQIAALAESEEDVRHECNKLVDAFIERAGLNIRGRHEYHIGSGRLDSKYQGVLLEYKCPKGQSRITEDLNSPSTRKVVEQLKRRLEDFEKEHNYRPERLFGAGCDANTVVFVRYSNGKWYVEDPKPTSKFSIERLLRALVSLGAHGYSFTPEHLSGHFGADSTIAQKGIRNLYQVISQTQNRRAKTFFGQWKVFFSEVCGYDVEGKTEKVRKLAEHYALPAGSQPADLLFAIHTYYAILMKFLAAEIASSFSPIGISVLKKCIGTSSSAQLHREMESLEQGGIWSQLGITNFLEGDLFSWYLSVWDDRVADMVWNMVRTFDEYDPGTLSGEPGESRDLLKRLYQELFPKSVRHDLGEYYTPDWLAEHALNEAGYEGNPDKRLLDPACGSGTFLVMAINRVKKWFEEHRYECGFSEAELVQKILSNIIGFDLNPLAVMAARTNYLLAIRDLFEFASGVEIPVYMCDSIVTPVEYGDLFTGRLAEVRKLNTSAGEFLIPSEVTSSHAQIGKYAEVVEFCVRNRYTSSDLFLESVNGRNICACLNYFEIIQ